MYLMVRTVLSRLELWMQQSRCKTVTERETRGGDEQGVWKMKAKGAALATFTYSPPVVLLGKLKLSVFRNEHLF